MSIQLLSDRKLFSFATKPRCSYNLGRSVFTATSGLWRGLLRPIRLSDFPTEKYRHASSLRIVASNKKKGSSYFDVEEKTRTTYLFTLLSA